MEAQDVPSSHASSSRRSQHHRIEHVDLLEELEGYEEAPHFTKEE